MHIDKEMCFIDGILHCDMHDCEQCQKDEEQWLEKWLGYERSELSMAVAGQPEPSMDVLNHS